jgi:hypothetical protein
LPFGVRQIRCVSHPQRIGVLGVKYKLTLKLVLCEFSNRL